MSNGRIFLLDNVDSFAYNLVDELAQLGFELEVYRNQVAADTIIQRMQQAAQKEPVLLCLSPGPGHPSEAGCLPELLEKASGRFPMLGICLGFQALIEHAGGSVGRAEFVMHGKTSALQLSPHPVFEGLSSPLQVARYHSLQAIQVPEQVQIIASYENIPMALYDAKNASIGYQFHPESIMTTYGSSLLQNTVNYLLAQAEKLECKN
ncbi:anthranilate synthase component II [Aliidiomarina minuta]|uniref:anthranilate synthase n=1 Tax=Aliidiomarina minuta TaxID=880057 RepID=A0A432W7R9_9GAMM|nr:aminodeoxychorismate/anthranilate synthase component II [Aliidiomarina minuta]RUO26137.1 anthranilate synthase component II [Aliidiomarina minuta]